MHIPCGSAGRVARPLEDCSHRLGSPSSKTRQKFINPFGGSRIDEPAAADRHLEARADLAVRPLAYGLSDQVRSSNPRFPRRARQRFLSPKSQIGSFLLHAIHHSASGASRWFFKLTMSGVSDQTYDCTSVSLLVCM